MKRLASIVHEQTLPHDGRLFVMPTKTKDVVRIVGSILGGPNHLPRGKGELAHLTASLLDAGTRQRTKTALRAAIADRGAELTFSAESDRLCFQASCLPEDTSFMLGLIAECLREPSFPKAELEVERQKAISTIKEEATDTRKQAAGELSRLMYEPVHPNYVESDKARLKALGAFERKDVVAFHKRLGQSGLVLVLVGDVSKGLASKAQRSFSSLPVGALEPTPKRPNTKPPMAVESRIAISEKANIDVYFGQSLPVRYGEPLYFPLMLLVNALGGGFAGHFMQTVRDRDGLTYGIRAMLCGAEPDTDGHLRIWSTFAPAILAKGLETIRKELAVFLTREVTSKSLERSKDEVTGDYAIRLSTTNGLAHTLHTIGMRNLPLERIHTYPELIRKVTIQELMEAAHLIAPKKLSLAAAGTFPKK